MRNRLKNERNTVAQIRQNFPVNLTPCFMINVHTRDSSRYSAPFQIVLKSRFLVCAGQAVLNLLADASAQRNLTQTGHRFQSFSFEGDNWLQSGRAANN